MADQMTATLHGNAVDAQNSIHQLAIGLAHAGANPQIVKQLSQWALELGQIAKQLAAAPVPGDGAVAPQQQATAPPPTPAPATPEQHHATLQAGASALHQAMQQSAQMQGR